MKMLLVRTQRTTSLFIATWVLAACVATNPPESAQSPATPEAETAAASGVSDVFRGLEASATTPELTDAERHSQHDHEGASDTNHGAQSGSMHEPNAHDQPVAASSTSPQDTRVYDCPMHPEVRQKGPGRCPKCGMNLEPAKPKGE